VQKILKACGYSLEKDAPTTVTAPAALAEAAAEESYEDLLQGEGSSDVELVEASAATELQPMNGELAKAEAEMAKIRALFAPSAPAAPSTKPLERHDSLVSIASSDAPDAAAAPAPAPAGASAEAQALAPAAASSKAPAKVGQGTGFSCGSYTNTPEGDGPLRGA